MYGMCVMFSILSLLVLLLQLNPGWYSPPWTFYLVLYTGYTTRQYPELCHNKSPAWRNVQQAVAHSLPLSPTTLKTPLRSPHGLSCTHGGTTLHGWWFCQLEPLAKGGSLYLEVPLEILESFPLWILLLDWQGPRITKITTSQVHCGLKGGT